MTRFGKTSPRAVGLAIIVLIGTGLCIAQTVPANYFNMMYHSPSAVAGSGVNSTGLRLWDTDTYWATLNPASGQYNWAPLDAWLTVAAANNQDLLFTFGHVPVWASSQPAVSCLFGGKEYGAGLCWPPADVNADGSGTDIAFTTFVSALCQHGACGTITYWEMWNEPYWPGFWSGTIPQLLRMVADAEAIIKSYNPNAKFVTPSLGGYYFQKWTTQFLAAGGAKYADIIGFHRYGSPTDSTCGVIPDSTLLGYEAQQLNLYLKRYGVTGKPVWHTEGNMRFWKKMCFTDPDMRAGWIAQWQITSIAAGVQRDYWYGCDNTTSGTLSIEAGGDQTTITAYNMLQTSAWLRGATLQGPCIVSQGTVTTCSLIRKDGRAAMAVWDTSQRCSGGVCTTSEYQTFAKQYVDLTGNTQNMKPGGFPIGYKPVLFLF
jgi:hypothetical protein